MVAPYSVGLVTKPANVKKSSSAPSLMAEAAAVAAAAAIAPSGSTPNRSSIDSGGSLVGGCSSLVLRAPIRRPTPPSIPSPPASICGSSSCRSNKSDASESLSPINEAPTTTTRIKKKKNKKKEKPEDDDDDVGSDVQVFDEDEDDEEGEDEDDDDDATYVTFNNNQNDNDNDNDCNRSVASKSVTFCLNPPQHHHYGYDDFDDDKHGDECCGFSINSTSKLERWSTGDGPSTASASASASTKSNRSSGNINTGRKGRRRKKTAASSKTNNKSNNNNNDTVARKPKRRSTLQINKEDDDSDDDQEDLQSKPGMIAFEQLLEEDEDDLDEEDEEEENSYVSGSRSSHTGRSKMSHSSSSSDCSLTLTEDRIRSHMMDYYEDYDTIFRQPNLKEEHWDAFFRQYFTSDIKWIRSTGNPLDRRGLAKLMLEDIVGIRMAIVSIDSIQLLAGGKAAVVVFTADQVYLYKGNPESDRTVLTSVLHVVNGCDILIGHEHRCVGKPIPE